MLAGAIIAPCPPGPVTCPFVGVPTLGFTADASLSIKDLGTWIPGTWVPGISVVLVDESSCALFVLIGVRKIVANSRSATMDFDPNLEIILNHPPYNSF